MRDVSCLHAGAGTAMGGQGGRLAGQWECRTPGSAQPSLAAPFRPSNLPAPPRRLTSYWAECEARLGGDLGAARAVWEGAVKGGVAGRYADAWAAFVDFERRRGNIREARALYKRSYRQARALCAPKFGLLDCC